MLELYFNFNYLNFTFYYSEYQRTDFDEPIYIFFTAFWFPYPLLSADNDCSTPWLIEFEFYELKENVSDTTIEKKFKEYFANTQRKLETLFPFISVDDITSRKLCEINFGYCHAAERPTQEVINRYLNKVNVFKSSITELIQLNSLKR